MPYVDLFGSDNITPINLKFYIPSYVLEELHRLDIKGYYFVRQSRIPIFLTQGFSIGVSNNAYIPLLGAYTSAEDSEDKTVCFRTDGPIFRTSANKEKYNDDGD